MEHLASHGWVVAAPDHVGNLTWDGGGRETEIYLQRPRDLMAVLDWLDAPGGDELQGRLSDVRLALGHSFGGYSIYAAAGASYDGEVLAACDDGSPFCSTMTPELADVFEQGFSEDRWVGVIGMDPGDRRLFGDGLADLTVPSLYMSADIEDEARAESMPYWDALDHPDDVWVSFPRLGHNGFTDVAGALDPPGVLDPEESWRLVRGTVLAWARAVGLGDPEAERLFSADSPLADAQRRLETR